MSSEYKEPPLGPGDEEWREMEPHPQLDPEAFCQVCGEHEYIGRCVCGRKLCSMCIEMGAGFCGKCDPSEFIDDNPLEQDDNQ